MRAFFLASLFLLSCCGQKTLPPIPGNVKAYQIYEEKGGLVRVQVNEIKPFAQAKDFHCQSPNHFEQTVSCAGGAVRDYFLRPDLGGIYRKQANDLMTYAEARGYFCVSDQDLGYILDQCD